MIFVSQPDLLNFKKGWMSKLDESGEVRLRRSKDAPASWSLHPCTLSVIAELKVGLVYMGKKDVDPH